MRIPRDVARGNPIYCGKVSADEKLQADNRDGGYLREILARLDGPRSVPS